MSYATEKALADDWNARHQVGTSVIVLGIQKREAKGVTSVPDREAVTTSEAHCYGSRKAGLAVVSVSGDQGLVTMNRIVVAPENGATG